ncbi:DUF4166 domain-containing protein [Occultella glacieicola]|uniref:DUF4166 domain-containing protein n=1 Tax=Occultella glacieicola TaxID=2518684 RepID=A0ABY2E448_9MICO|nr:DUF4166 domain-containing protein [Occultella glacieicola]TDE91533.1 DUF4166 domain-containing protein [Occultella glacieicola]
MATPHRSPYEVVLGGRLSELHPRLQRYFTTIPPSHVGVGEGAFTRAGTPHRWLWPVIRVLERRHVVFAGWARQVPFRIQNRTIDGRAVATREFQLPGRTWTMTDEVVCAPGGGVADRLGTPATVAATFDVSTVAGALVLTSRTVGLRYGWLRVRIPRRIRPTIRLHESYDDARAQQRVDLTVDLPILGRVYGYGGYFTYRIEKEPA